MRGGKNGEEKRDLDNAIASSVSFQISFTNCFFTTEETVPQEFRGLFPSPRPGGGILSSSRGTAAPGKPAPANESVLWSLTKAAQEKNLGGGGSRRWSLINKILSCGVVASLNPCPRLPSAPFFTAQETSLKQKKFFPRNPRNIYPARALARAARDRRFPSLLPSENYKPLLRSRSSPGYLTDRRVVCRPIYATRNEQLQYQPIP